MIRAQKRHRESFRASGSRQVPAPSWTAGAPSPFPSWHGRLGNRGVQRLLQAKLAISQPDDPLEREADRVAERVMRSPSGPEAVPLSPDRGPGTTGADPTAPTTADPAGTPVPDELAGRIDALEGKGRPLPESARRFFEPRLGRDLTRVRLHTDRAAADLAVSVQARAFTAGRHVVFGNGEYRPDAAEGKCLLAHELAHVAQQGQAAPIPGEGARGDATATAQATRHVARQEEAEPTRRPRIEVEVGGERVEVDPSMFPQGIWWFNGETPTMAPFYPTEQDLNPGLPATGDFEFEVTQGADRLGILEGGRVVRTRRAQNDPVVRVRGLGASTARGDVRLTIRHTPPGATRTALYSSALEVRAPRMSELLGCSHAAAGSNGYRSTFRMRLLDNFDVPMPFMNINEDFTSGTLSSGVSSDWRAAFTARTRGNALTDRGGEFQDMYEVMFTSGVIPSLRRLVSPVVPPPENPRSPLGSHLVGTFTHWWYAGSPTPGRGIKVSEHTGRLFSDHGQYRSFFSPPTFILRPRDCPP